VQLNIEFSSGSVATHFRWDGRSYTIFSAVHPQIWQ